MFNKDRWYIFQPFHLQFTTLLLIASFVACNAGDNPQVQHLSETEDNILDPTSYIVKANLLRVKRFTYLENICVNSIQSGDTDEALQTFYQLPGYSLSNVIKNSFGNDVKNIKNVFKFISKIQNDDQQILAIVNLYQEIRKNNLALSQVNNFLETSDILIFAKTLKKLMISEQYSYVNRGDKNLFEHIKLSLPTLIRSVVWSTPIECFLKNVEYNETLYVSQDQRKVYTLIHPYLVELSSKWKIEAKLSDDTIRYTFQNLFYRNEYLSVDFNGSVKTKLYSQTLWDIELMESANVVKIRHPNLGYLVASNVDENANNRRFTNVQDVSVHTDALWKIVTYRH